MWVNVVLNRTVAVDNDWFFDNQWGSNLPSQSELHDISWWYYILCGSCIIQWIAFSSFWTTETSVGCIKLKYRRDQKRIKEITNLRMKYYMINSIVQTILLTAFLIKFAFNTKTCKLINFLLHSIKFLNLQEINHACHASLSKSWKNRERESTKRMFEIILLWLARSPYVSMKHRHVHTLYQLTAGTAHHNFELRIYAQLSPKPLGPACQLSVRLREMSIL